MLSQFWGIFAFHIDPPDKPKFDIDQIDRPVLPGQLLVQLAGQFLMQFSTQGLCCCNMAVQIYDGENV